MSDKYIEILESFKERKGMYVLPEELESVANFLSGFMSAVISQALRSQYPHDLLHEVGERRGWKKSACGPIYHIRESDLSENDKMNELIDIYIESVKTLLSEKETRNA